MSKVIHIFGAPRSGTTWLWSLLESHDKITPFINGKKVDGKYSTSESGYILKPNLIKQFTNFCKKHDVVIEKTPTHTLHYGQIKKLFPNSLNLLIVRHPISIYNSYVKSNLKALPKSKNLVIADIKKYYAKYNGIGAKSLVVVYEKMVDDPDGELSKIFDFIGMEKPQYDDFNTQGKVNLKHVFRKGKKYSYTEDLAPELVKELEKALSNEIVYWKKLNEK